MKIRRFEDIIAWQKSKKFSIDLYAIFMNVRDFGFRDQILRAVISIMNNIAEGFERGTNKEFRNFLYIAKGSCAEIRSMLYVALELKYINREQSEKFINDSEEISRLISGLIKTL